MKVTYVHRLDFRNAGDLFSGPYDWFDLPPGQVVDIGNLRNRHWSRLRKSSHVVIGGGGLYHPHFREALNAILDLPNVKKVGWGIGTNTHYVTAPPTWSSRGHEFKFDLLGTRDFNYADFNFGGEYVPCASAMSDAFDKNYIPNHPAVIYSHHEHQIPISGYPQKSNNTDSMRDVVKFLGSGEAVITNSYHGAYWATLLGRRVVVYRPFSTRFHYLKYPPAMAYDPGSLKVALANALWYPAALEDSRSHNVAFHKRVMKFLGV